MLKDTFDTITKYLLFVISFFLPFYNPIARVCFLLLIIVSLHRFPFLLSKKKSPSFFLILFSSFFTFALISLLYTENWQQGFAEIDQKLPLLFFPLIIFSLPFKELKVDKYLRLFIWGCTTACLYMLGRATYAYFFTDKNHFFYVHLTAYLDTHPTYVGMYILFALLLLLKQLLKTYRLQNNILIILGILFFLGILFLLSSRIVVLGLFLIGGSSILYYLFHTQRWKIGLSIIMITLLFFVVFLQTNNTMSKRFASTTDARSYLWQNATELIIQQPFFGFGIGDVKDELKKGYEERGKIYHLKKEHDTHNQYLEVAVGMGMIGLFLFLLTLFIPFFIAIDYKMDTYLLFLSIILLVCLTESILERQMGVLFYAFFNSLFAYQLVAKER